MGRPVKFSQSDVTRAAKAMTAAGLNVAGVEIAADGTIRVLTHAPAAPERALSALEQWERENGLGAA